jgi:hypothetical protein
MLLAADPTKQNKDEDHGVDEHVILMAALLDDPKMPGLASSDTRPR